MSRIRGKNTVPELRVRGLLHAQGFRFRLHRKDLPGSPDIVLPRYRVAILVHGCFWHLHEGCRLAKIPGSREDFWRTKLFRNRERDASAISALRAGGWRVLVVWECYLRAVKDDQVLVRALVDWINGDLLVGELSNSVRADIVI